ncbi:hypothetical protein D9756_003110 [Leucocoprinus leucothites]|uniref:Choline/carnitine acyltransferase domain-containing protein n=1 Tax=Leucocoprinus leucothites TaxID=201217 RepID=A0A8H5LIW3_9AGAR|nr:hypothetical protein D9756_003110 [Leucoagaricus leucothites]
MRSRSSSNSALSSQAPKLPRLPVPDLRKTLDKYLTSIEPFLRESEKSPQSFSAAYQVRKQWADEFYAGIGSILQERLVGVYPMKLVRIYKLTPRTTALEKKSPNNWLDDNFWLKKAYLEWRAPLLINSNWWLAFYDDDLIPPASRESYHVKEGMAGATTWQLRRSAWLVHRMLEFKDRLDTQELHPETTRTGIWLRDSTSKMFNTARIPQQHSDILSTLPSKPHSLPARSLLVMFHNFCYTIPVYSPAGELASSREIYHRLRQVVTDVDARRNAGEEAFPIGVLSADDRDIWAKNLQYLLSLSPTNKTSHEALLTSVMALSLEVTSATHLGHDQPHSTAQDSLDSHLHLIRGTSDNIANRFFDKPYTVLVDSLARAGASGEHSPCDALVPSIVAEYGVVQGVEEAAFPTPEMEDSPTAMGGEDGFTRFDWVADDRLSKECQAAKQRALEIIKDSDDSVLWFDRYGTDWIKGVAKFSPDAYIQMALQLAWYRTRGEFTATYETVLTRMFKRGRTETLRSFTSDSRAWVLAMTEYQKQSDPQTQFNLLTKAITTHAKLTREAATGRGIDRHLLGLQLVLKPEEPLPYLFTDPLFLKSQEWKLSTSGLSAGHWFKGTGFGAAFKDGYGINYLAAPEMIKFGIESKFSSPATSTAAFKIAITDALEDMSSICLAGLPISQITSIRSHL